MLKFEKGNLNRIRYFVNYRIVPLYLGFVAICIIIIMTLMTMDEVRYTPIAIGLFILIGVITIALLISVPYTRKAEIAIELKRYHFDTSNVETKDVYHFSKEEASFSFDKNGMYVHNTFLGYNRLKVFINTSNRLNRIWISIVFLINETDSYDIPLNAETINMIEKFNIHLLNPEALDFIVHHKEEAFTKIYKFGHV